MRYFAFIAISIVFRLSNTSLPFRESASSKDFLSITSPEVAIYMAGEGNIYGHPHEETIISLSNIGAMICGTDVHGTIVVITNGQSYTIQSSHPNPPVISESEPT